MKKNRWLFLVSALGALVGVAAAVFYAQQKPPLPPVFQPAANPYRSGIYANGIVESEQDSGANVNVYPEVTGTVARIAVREGQAVKRGDELLTIEDSVQRALAQQQSAQADAADAQLAQLLAQPRKETLEVAQAQVDAAAASLKTVEDQYDKLHKSWQIDARSVSQDAMDNAANAVGVARSSLVVARRQLALTRAGAWTYDIRNQEKQRDALRKAADAADALLRKYVVRAPMDGVVLSVNTAVGAYVSPQGTYDTYTQGNQPVAVLSSQQDWLAVRVYVDEILVHRLQLSRGMQARMFVRGTDTSITLEFVRLQPYLTPKIQLSDQRTERVDVRVLPVIFRFRRPSQPAIYPGQLVDVYLGGAP
ncbi:HlyD family efflux transporter periplasmic adaptor subunit [Cupriavidus sp. WKF15]|uniref:HlyD family secretion protein n=1 Tax=Cupriavidus sp. WKF15 TaxID=3032282 RepID=UPI0023E2E7B4|nr:HlyD family efflux transporter periplasmic adaptor subunit [Cupriavidus sp. WKF15]WER50628.1 HlyD family efflux transporter periplasmic adaptor subunit [Cupriavidus sp. WKF15]